MSDKRAGKHFGIKSINTLVDDINTSVDGRGNTTYNNSKRVHRVGIYIPVLIFISILILTILISNDMVKIQFQKRSLNSSSKNIDQKLLKSVEITSDSHASHYHLLSTQQPKNMTLGNSKTQALPTEREEMRI
jgi:hypothetical protein